MEPETVVFLARRISQEFDCLCRFLYAWPVRELYKGRVIWTGSVGVFSIKRNSGPGICYAWMADELMDTAMPVVILKTAAVSSPAQAVGQYSRRQCTERG